MNKKIIELKEDPIVEVVFEVRFGSDRPQVRAVLPGLIYSQLKSTYPDIEEISSSKVSQESFDKEPGRAYIATTRLVGKNNMIQIGEKVVSLSIAKPYPLWLEFRRKIEELLKALKETNLITRVERFSLKYINFINVEHINSGRQLDAVKLDINLGPYNLLENETGFNLRTEIKNDDMVTIVQVTPNILAKIDNESLKGLILDIDTIFQGKLSGIDDISDNLEKCRSKEREIFLNVLSKNALESMKPVRE